MNGKERVAAVMRGGRPDRVPVMCQLSTPHVIKHSTLPPAEFHLNYNEAFGESLFTLAKKYNFDGVLLDSSGYDTKAMQSRVKSIETQHDGQTINWENGSQTFCPANASPIARGGTTIQRKPVEEIAIADLPLPGMYAAKLADLPDFTTAAFRHALKLMGDTLSVHSFVGAPLTALFAVAGIEEALIGLLEAPEHCKMMLEFLTEASKTCVDNMLALGMHAICVTAPFEGASFISKPMYAEFAAPYTKQLVAHINSTGAPCYIHMCGKISDRLELLADSGIDGLECLDPPPLGDVELDDAVARIGQRVFIKGNIDPVNTLLAKTPQEVYDDAAERIKTAAGTGRYILSTACSVAADTPAENLQILVKAAEKYGTY